jgi:putative FmdB family regulatory protein
VIAYQYRCQQDGAVDLRWPMGSAPEQARCPSCGGSVARSISAPMLSLAPRARMAAIDRAEKSADAPDVVSNLPPRSARQRTPRATSPLQQRLPRP